MISIVGSVAVRSPRLPLVGTPSDWITNPIPISLWKLASNDSTGISILASRAGFSRHRAANEQLDGKVVDCMEQVSDE